MVENYAAPIDHSAGSAAAQTAAGAAGGALKTGAKWWAAVAVIGAAVGLFAGLVLTGIVPITIVSGALAEISGMGLLKVATIAATTIIGGAVAASTLGPVAGAIGGTIGGVKGGGRAAHRVGEERGAAAAMQAQIEMVRAQSPAPAQTVVYAPAANNNSTGLPAYGDAMNAAAPQISNMQYEGPINGQQLAAAR